MKENCYNAYILLFYVTDVLFRYHIKIYQFCFTPPHALICTVGSKRLSTYGYFLEKNAKLIDSDDLKKKDYTYTDS